MTKVEWTTPFSPSAPKHTTSELMARIAYVRDNLSYSKLLRNYNIAWRGDEEHQFSCHFHGRDKNPSAHYYAMEKRVWCFACSEGGDVVWWVKKKENLKNVGEALDFIAKEFGVGLSSTDLTKRIELTKNFQQTDRKREIYSNRVCAHVNDYIYKARALYPKAEERFDAIEDTLFERKQEIDQSPSDYHTYVAAIRNWQEWALSLLRQFEEQQRQVG